MRSRMEAPRRPVLESPRNERLRAWAKLRDARHRRREGLFLAEGPHLAEEAVAAGVRIAAAVAAPDFEVEGLLPRGTEIVRAAPRALAVLEETPSSQGIVLVCRRPEPAAAPGDGGRWLLLDNLQDPGNVGSLVRTAHAAGIDGVVLGRGCADAYSMKCLRAAQGSTFHLPVAEADLGAWIPAARAGGLRVLSTNPAGVGARSYRAVPPGGRGWALLIGAEGAGVDPALDALADERLLIPMPGGAESLGAAAAGAILLFHLCGPAGGGAE